MDEASTDKKTHSIFLENRKTLEMNGVDEVNNFDEQRISANTNLGLIVVKGYKLQVQKFNTKTKNLKITGKINEIKYPENKKTEHKSFFSRLFK